MANETNGRRFTPSKVIQRYAPGNVSLIRTRYQSPNGGANIYDAELIEGEPAFNELYHNIWRMFFRPSVNVAKVIDDQLTKMDLVPGHYASAHVRALYGIPYRPLDQIESWTRNALNCASNLRPGAPIFFASDSSNASTLAKEYAEIKGARVETHTPNPNPPLHLDRADDWELRPISDFYDTFVDLYLIALGGCVTLNKGGFGHWALLIGSDYQCRIHQKTATTGTIRRICDWVETSESPQQQKPERTTLLFLEPMESLPSKSNKVIERGLGAARDYSQNKSVPNNSILANDFHLPGGVREASQNKTKVKVVNAASQNKTNLKIVDHALLDRPRPKFPKNVNTSFYNISSDGTNLWDTDPKIPEWMKAYMNWHKWKRTTWNTQTNWTSERWLIMQCFGDQDNKRCGGTADRLKPIPFMLRIAYKHQRILLIRWTRPAMLEEFLVPPKGGFDWRVPEWMANVVSRGSYGLMCISIGFGWWHLTNFSSTVVDGQ
jgi:hypothetical protein